MFVEGVRGAHLASAALSPGKEWSKGQGQEMGMLGSFQTTCSNGPCKCWELLGVVGWGGSQAAIGQQFYMRISGTKPKELQRKGPECLRFQ